VVGTIFSALTTTLWLVISCKTIYLAYGGSIFHAPCLDGAPLPLCLDNASLAPSSDGAPLDPIWPQSKEDGEVAGVDALPVLVSPDRGLLQEMAHLFEQPSAILTK
jgi:hypothetical protein